MSQTVRLLVLTSVLWCIGDEPARACQPLGTCIVAGALDSPPGGTADAPTNVQLRVQYITTGGARSEAPLLLTEAGELVTVEWERKVDLSDQATRETWVGRPARELTALTPYRVADHYRDGCTAETGCWLCRGAAARTLGTFVTGSSADLEPPASPRISGVEVAAPASELGWSCGAYEGCTFAVGVQVAGPSDMLQVSGPGGVRYIESDALRGVVHRSRWPGPFPYTSFTQRTAADYTVSTRDLAGNESVAVPLHVPDCDWSRLQVVDAGAMPAAGRADASLASPPEGRRSPGGCSVGEGPRSLAPLALTILSVLLLRRRRRR